MCSRLLAPQSGAPLYFEYAEVCLIAHLCCQRVMNSRSQGGIKQMTGQYGGKCPDPNTS